MRKSVDSWLERFCHKHPNLGVPGLIKYVVILNLGVYFLDTFSQSALSTLLAFSPYYIFQGQIWRLFTFVFVPLSSSTFTMLISLYFYWFIGTTLEREWGATKFTVYYVMGILFTIVAGFVLYFAGWGFFTSIYVNMYYVNMSMFLAFASLYPNMQVLLFFILPIKVKWLAWLDLGLFAYACIQYVVGGVWMLCLIPVAALLNYLLFFWSDLMEIFGNTKYKAQRSRKTTDFKKATQHSKEQKGYIHKCAVCGKTDTTNPEIEFRYCSKCNGYYCYCTDHLANHEHID